MQVPVVTRTSQATRPMGSSASTASRTASEIWSAILSGWPSVTDSEVKMCFCVSDKFLLLEEFQQHATAGQEACPTNTGNDPACTDLRRKRRGSPPAFCSTW